jgi:1-deoxy-D-xylulose 5-phosphate reductoisomerase
MTTVAILGSTGSIGTQTLDVVRAEGDRFEVRSAPAPPSRRWPNKRRW